MKDIYKEIAGHKGYKRIYTRISCVVEDILIYHKGYPVISMMLSCQRYPFISIKLILDLFELRDILGYLRISEDILGYLFGANSQMATRDSGSTMHGALTGLILRKGLGGIPRRSVLTPRVTKIPPFNAHDLGAYSLAIDILSH